MAVDDEQLRDALELLGSAGIDVEPSSAATIAGLEVLSRSVAMTGGSIVVILTGTALRWPATFGRVRQQGAKVAAPEVEALSSVLKI